MKKLILVVFVYLSCVAQSQTIHKFVIAFNGTIEVTYNDGATKSIDTVSIDTYHNFVLMLKAEVGEGVSNVIFYDNTIAKQDILQVKSTNNNWFIGVYEKLKFAYGLNEQQREIFTGFLNEIKTEL